MIKASESTRFDVVSIILHWAVGISILGLTAIGIYMVNFEVWSLYDIHKSLGILLLLIILVRVYWRIKKRFPSPDNRFSKFENRASKIVQLLLITLTLLLPVSGMLYSAASGHGFELFSLPLVPEKHGADGNVVPRNESASDISSLLHTTFGYVLLFLVSLHVLGALKHHFIYRNEILSRMLSFRRSR